MGSGERLQEQLRSSAPSPPLRHGSRGLPGGGSMCPSPSPRCGLPARFAQLESVCALGQGVLEVWLGLEQRRAPVPSSDGVVPPGGGDGNRCRRAGELCCSLGPAKLPSAPRGWCEELEGAALGNKPPGGCKVLSPPGKGAKRTRSPLPLLQAGGGGWTDGLTDGRGSPPRALLLPRCLHGTEPGVVKSNEVMSKKTFQESLWAVFSPCCAAKGRLGTSPSSAGSSPLCPCPPEVCPGATGQCRTGGAGAAPGEMRGCGTAR